MIQMYTSISGGVPAGPCAKRTQFDRRRESHPVAKTPQALPRISPGLVGQDAGAVCQTNPTRPTFKGKLGSEDVRTELMDGIFKNNDGIRGRTGGRVVA
jgi:hypothetical protein